MISFESDTVSTTGADTIPHAGSNMPVRARRLRYGSSDMATPVCPRFDPSVTNPGEQRLRPGLVTLAYLSVAVSTSRIRDGRMTSG